MFEASSILVASRELTHYISPRAEGMYGLQLCREGTVGCPVVLVFVCCVP